MKLAMKIYGWLLIMIALPALMWNLAYSRSWLVTISLVVLIVLGFILFDKGDYKGYGGHWTDNLTTKLFYKEVKFKVWCPYCEHYTGYTNGFIKRFGKPSPIHLNPTCPHWAVTCEHCGTSFEFRINITEYRSEFND